MDKPTPQCQDTPNAPPAQFQQNIQYYQYPQQNIYNQQHPLDQNIINRQIDMYNQNNQLYNVPSNQPMYINQNFVYPQQQINQINNQRFGGIQYIFVSDPLTELNNCSGVLIKQEPELLEILTGCETPNRYHVFGQTNSGYIYLFKCLEKSGFCMRNCCPSSMREFNMEIRHMGSVEEINPGMSKLFTNIYKPFKCVCCCFNRPEMIITLNNGEFIGKIYNPFTCCDPEYEIYDSNNQLKYYINADCCQCGLLCNNTICGKCSEAKFIIFDRKYGNQIGIISKNVAQFHEIISNADSYKIIFPNNATPKEKLLLICLGLMIDYQHFEQNNSPNNRRGYYYY